MHEDTVLTQTVADDLANILDRYDGSYASKWIEAALDFYRDGYYEDAFQAFSKARDAFLPDDNPEEYRVLSTWVEDTDKKRGTVVDTEEELSSSGDDMGDIVKSLLITKADAEVLSADLADISSRYAGEYAGTHINSALDLYSKGFFEEAGEEFEKARDSFLPEDNPDEWNTLDMWANDSYARSLNEGPEPVAAGPENKAKSSMKCPKCDSENCTMEGGKCTCADCGNSWMAEEKSAVEKADAAGPDKACMKSLWQQYYKYYSGKWLATANKLMNEKKYPQAAKAFEKARDGFQEDKNPKEFACLDSWVKYASSMK